MCLYEALLPSLRMCAIAYGVCVIEAEQRPHVACLFAQADARRAEDCRGLLPEVSVHLAPLVVRVPEAPLLGAAPSRDKVLKVDRDGVPEQSEGGYRSLDDSVCPEGYHVRDQTSIPDLAQRAPGIAPANHQLRSPDRS